jgi:hypothetical protein
MRLFGTTNILYVYLMHRRFLQPRMSLSKNNHLFMINKFYKIASDKRLCE